MNNNYSYPNYTPIIPNGNNGNIRVSTPSVVNNNQSNRVTYQEPEYAENILSLNAGKNASFYMSYNDSIDWRNRVFTGVINEAGRDYTLLKDSETGKDILLWNIYIDFVIFNDPISQ